MILDNGIAKTPQQVGYYSGVIESVFSVMSLIASTLSFIRAAINPIILTTSVFPLGALSQRIGRKPIIVAGNLGLAISVGFFGVSRTFLEMLFSRCIAGVLGATLSIAKTMQAEISNASNEGVIVSTSIVCLPQTYQ